MFTRRSNRLPGRHVVPALVLTAVVVAASACGSAEPAESSSSSLGTELTVGGPGGTLGTVYKGIFQSFADANDIKLTYIEGTTSDNYAKAAAQAQANNVQIDLLHTNDTTAAQGEARGVFEPIDKAAVPNGSQVVAIEGAPEVGGVRAFLTMVGIFYNKTVFATNSWPAPTSWTDLYNPAYASCSLLPNSASSGNLLPMLAMFNKISSGDFANIEAGLNVLAPNASRLSSSSSDEALSRVASGASCISIATQGRVLAEDNADIEWVAPKEGSAVQAVTLELMKGAPHKAAALAAINYFLSAEQQVKLYSVFFAPTNKSAAPPASGPGSTVIGPDRFASVKAFVPPAELNGMYAEWLPKYNQLLGG